MRVWGGGGEQVEHARVGGVVRRDRDEDEDEGHEKHGEARAPRDALLALVRGGGVRAVCARHARA